MSPRTIVGNLDCEVAWSVPPAQLPEPVMRRLGTMSVLVAALARDGDRLWTPRPVDPCRLFVSSWLPRVELSSGRPPRDAQCLLAWGQTEDVRGRPEPARPESGRDRLCDHLWSAPVAAPAVARAVNDKTWQHALAQEIGCGLPGAAVLRDPEAIPAAVARLGRGWVLKAPWSAAGRGHVVGAEPMSRRQARRARGMLRAAGALVLEPWCDRVQDFGLTGIVGDAGLAAVGEHRLLVTARGGFAGIDTRPPELTDAHRRRLHAVIEAVGRRLHERGYRGPFGVDAFTYRDAGGALCLQPMSEVNARLSFGWVARALAERADGPVRLSLGSRPAERPAAAATCLIAPTDADPLGAWVAPAHGSSMP